jgi:hypothetical protein
VWRNSASTPATAPPCARWPLSTAAWSPATWRARYSAGMTPGTIAVLALAVLPAVGFYVERTSATPMLPLAILAAPTRRASVAAMLLIGAILAGYVYFTSLYLQKVLGFSPVATGLGLIPSSATVVLTSTLGTRRLLARLTVKQVLLAGLACMGGGQLWLAQVTVGAIRGQVVVRMPRRMGQMPGPAVGVDVSPDPGD